MAVKKRLLKSGREKGAVIVEMALVAPLIMLVVAGIIDMGLLYWEKNVLTNAAREGARAGARATAGGGPEKTVTQVRQVVQDYLDSFKIKDPAGVPITLNSSNCLYQWDTSQDPATLWVELQDIPIGMILLPNIQKLFSGGGISLVVNLSSRTTMAAEWDKTKPPSP